jgi:hypothetical protein
MANTLSSLCDLGQPKQPEPKEQNTKVITMRKSVKLNAKSLDELKKRAKPCEVLANSQSNSPNPVDKISIDDFILFCVGLLLIDHRRRRVREGLSGAVHEEPRVLRHKSDI